MKWNWQKIDDDNKNVPDFKQVVLLYEEKDGKHLVTVGNLKSIDANGLHWKLAGGNINDFFVGMFETNPQTNKIFYPTHWCKVELPFFN